MSIGLKADSSGTFGTIQVGGADQVTVTNAGALTTNGGLAIGGLLSLYAPSGIFNKSNPAIVAFAKSGNGTATTQVVLTVEIAGTGYLYATSTNIVMPTLTAGTDYAVYACTDGTIRADANFTTATGYTATTCRKIGGFHYAPGGNAAAQAGGNTTPQINPYSFWDLKFKPNCADPRGMVYCGSNFWADIYLTNTNYITNGTSKYNVTIADGSSPPLISTLAGGTGSNSYSTYTWWDASEVMSYAGKRLPRYAEFQLLAYGTTENTSIGTDPVSTVWNAAYVSKYGVNQASGVMWTWGADFGGGAAAAVWANTNGGRGQVYQQCNAAVFGGAWYHGAYAGSRSSSWADLPSDSGVSIGSRAVCDHLILV